jgi:hypothetical protein
MYRHLDPSIVFGNRQALIPVVIDDQCCKLKQILQDSIVGRGVG